MHLALQLSIVTVFVATKHETHQAMCRCCAHEVLRHNASASAGPQCAVHHHMAMQKPVLREMAARHRAERTQTFDDWCARLGDRPT